MAITICFPAQKGGVGKTTATVNIAAAFAKKGARVLILDCDGQANSTELTLGVEMWDENDLPIIDGTPWQGICAAVNEGKQLSSLIRDTNVENLKIVPHERNNLRGAEILLESSLNSMGRAGYNVFKNLISEELIQENFDLIFIDNPPSTGMVPTNSLLASDMVLIPSFAEKFSQNGIGKILRYINTLIEMGDKIKVLGIVITKLDKRSPKNLSDLNSHLNKIELKYGVQALDTKIGVCAALSRSEDVAETWELTELKKASKDFDALAEELWELMTADTDSSRQPSLKEQGL